MARIYFTFQALKEIDGDYKPGGTLGTHRMAVYHQEGGIIDVFGMTSGGYQSHLKLNPEEKNLQGIVYDSGKIDLLYWSKHPVKRVLQEQLFSKYMLKMVDELPSEHTEVETHNMPWPNETWLKHKETRTIKILSPDVAIETKTVWSRTPDCFNQEKKFTMAIYLKKQANNDAAAAALREYFNENNN